MSAAETSVPEQEAAHPEAPALASRPARRRRLWLRLPLAVLVQGLLLVLAVLLWVLGTQSGLRFALGVAEDLAPGLLRVERVQGRVLGDLHLSEVVVNAPGMELALGDASLRWSPLGILTGTLRVRELRIRDLDLALEPSEEQAEEPGDEAPLQLPDIVLPVDIEIERVSVEGLSLSQPSDAPPFRVDRASLSASLRGSRLTLRELTVALPEPRLDAAATGGVELADGYPLDLSLDWSLRKEPALELSGKGTVNGDLERLNLAHRLAGSAEVVLEAVLSNLLESPSWEANLEIARVDLPAIQAELPAMDLQGSLTTSGDLNEARVQGRLQGEAPELPDFGHLGADLDLTWRDQVLTITDLELTEEESGALFSAEGVVDLSGEVGALGIGAVWENLRWPLTGELIAEARQGKLDVTGTFEAYSYSLQAEAWGPDFPEAAVSLTGEGDLESTRIQRLELAILAGEVSATGDVSWVPEPAWDLSLEADDIDTSLQWPDLPMKLALVLTSTGNLDAFGYDLEGQVDSDAVPSAKLSLAGEGDIRGTRVETLQVDTLGGTIAAVATAAWSPGVAWDAQVDLADIDPGTQWPEWKGTLKGHLASAGSLTDEGPDLTALIDGLGGTLRGYPVKADGRVAVRGTDVKIQEFLFASGPSRLAADGTISEEVLDLRFDLESPDLRSLLPDATGSFDAKGTVAGTFSAPAVNLDLAANAVEVAGQGIERLSGKAELDLAGGGSLRIDLDGKRLLAGGMLFDSLQVKGDGELASHRLSAALRGDPLALELQAGGGLGENNAYRGQLGSLAIRTRDFGSWRLQKSADIAIEGERLSAGPFCIRDEAGSGGCAGFAQSGTGSWTANLDLDRLAFDLLAAFLPEGLFLDGYLGAKAEFKAEGDLLTGTADLGIPEGVIRTDTQDGVEVLNFSSARVRLDAGSGGLKAGLNIPLTGLGSLAGDVALPGWSLADPARPSQPLKGRIQAGIDDLAIMSRLAPDLTNVTGRIDVDLGLNGSIAMPGFAGHARLTGGGMEVPFIGLAISDLSFAAEAARKRVDFSGGFTAGDGRLEIVGQGLAGRDGMAVEVKTSGERLTLANSKEYFLLASPDIKVKAGPKGAAIDGVVLVPEARIRPRNIPEGAVSPSADVVMGTEEEEQPAFPLDLRIRLKLGENVRIDAFGLTAKLAGDLLVFQEPGKELLGDGQLKVVDGKYRLSTGSKLTAAVGKPLKVEQGIIVFAKTPLSNPGLVLSAKRDGGDVTAGVRVFGTAKDPKLTFFSDSDPGMTQSEATSYLLTGIPPRRNAGKNEDRALSVGTYIAPKLFMEYDSSLGDEQDTVKLRYEYNRWLEFQTETGEGQGADVFFKFER